MKMNPCMTTTGLLLLCLVQSVCAQQSPAAAPAKAPLGRWITESGNLEVDIGPCAGETLCGKVVRVLGNRSMSAPGADRAAADARPALGMTLLSSLRLRDGDNTEYQGEIYNRESAKTYSATLTPAEPDQLLVRAYVGIPLFGKTQVWRRPSTDQGASQ